MSKPRNDLYDRLVYLGVRLFSVLVHVVPIRLDLEVAQWLGSLWHRFDHRHRARSIANLQRSFPNWSHSECDTLARKSVQHVFMLACEMLHTPRLIHIGTWRQYVELENFQQTLQLLMNRGQGAIMLTGHYGNWEILGYVLAILGFDTTSVARPIDNPHLNDWVFGVRAQRGQKVIGKKGATSEITQLLSQGGVVAFVADQNAGSKGVFVDFFGRKASTYKSIGLLAMEYQIPIVIGYARRLNTDFHFRIATQDIIWPVDWKNQDDPLRYITQRYTKAIEDFVRADPSQYLWAHRRWKTRPKGERPLKYD